MSDLPAPVSHLTPKQAQFVDRYLECGDAVAAYKSSYDADGMAPASLRNEAYRLVRHPKLAAIIAERQAAAAELANISAARRMVILNDLVEADPRELFTVVREPCPACHAQRRRATPNKRCKSCSGKGRVRLDVRPSAEWSPQAARLVRGARVRGDEVELLLVDKLVCSDQLNRMQNCYSETRLNANLNYSVPAPAPKRTPTIDELLLLLQPKAP
jgi:phage terminase small subunit